MSVDLIVVPVLSGRQLIKNNEIYVTYVLVDE